MYGYADGDPINNADPFGLWPDPIKLAVGTTKWMSSDWGKAATVLACIAGCRGTSAAAQEQIDEVHSEFPLALMSVRKLPPSMIAEEGGVRVLHNYRSGDHGPAHAHVVGGGTTTRIGPKGHPLAGDPATSAARRAAIEAHANKIRNAINKIGRWLASQEKQ